MFKAVCVRNFNICGPLFTSVSVVLPFFFFAQIIFFLDSLVLYGCSCINLCVYDISELYSTRSKNKYKLSKYQERQQNICLTFHCVRRLYSVFMKVPLSRFSNQKYKYMHT